ncbi:MAG: glucan biosynthesis protein, partial [Rubrimonas sp.]
FMRHGVPRFGIAPLTAMYWYSERDHVIARDWRPEIHDSDGLALLTGAGERLWRPLANPQRVTMSGFMDENPRGFGLIQRDRDFENYLDDGVWYDRRPSAWVTPLGDWGRGSVRLLEIPTDDETFDNIVAFWEPETTPEPGEEVAFAWRIDWVETDPDSGMGRVVATRTGEGGIPGQPGPEGSVKYVVDFEGGPLADLPREAEVRANVETTVGRLEAVTAYQVVGTNRWRMIFDLEDAQGQAADLRAFLSLDGAPLTETWIALSEPETGRPA